MTSHHYAILDYGDADNEQWLRVRPSIGKFKFVGKNKNSDLWLDNNLITYGHKLNHIKLKATYIDTEEIDVNDYTRKFQIHDSHLELDNSFWVSFDEFIYQFEYVAICHTRNYQKTIVKGKFQQAFDDAVSDQNSVISKFYYTLNIQKDDTEVILGIQQEDDSAIG